MFSEDLDVFEHHYTRNEINSCCGVRVGRERGEREGGGREEGRREGREGEGRRREVHISL